MANEEILRKQDEPLDNSNKPLEMGRRQIAVWVAVIAAAVLVIVGWGIYDWTLRSGRMQDCGDGPRGRIDLRDFVHQYSAWSISFEAEIQGKGKAGTKLEPSQTQQLSEAVQQASEFRKYVVAGYNACAITKEQYGRFGVLFQDLDAIERRISQFTAKSSLSSAERTELDRLVVEFVGVSKKLRQ